MVVGGERNSTAEGRNGGRWWAYVSEYSEKKKGSRGGFCTCMSLSHKRQRSPSGGDAEARKRAFPSAELLAEEQAPELATLDAEDIRLAPLAPHFPDPFPATEPDTEYPPLPSPELVDEIDDLDLTLPAPTSSPHTPPSDDQSPSSPLPTTQTQPPPPAMSSSPATAPVQPTRPRARGVDPDSLKTVATRWEEDSFEEAAAEDVAYPYVEGLNERVVVWFVLPLFGSSLAGRRRAEPSFAGGEISRHSPSMRS